MFKKLFLAVIALAGFAASAAARDGYTRDVNVLPVAAQTTVANNCKAKISLIKVEKTLGRVSEYEVILTDGTEISFDRDGNWESVEVKASASVPEAFVPATIAKYVKETQKKQHIVGIDRDKHGYEVELSNGVEMKFDPQGRFLKFD